MNQSILFDDLHQTFQILDGTRGTYTYSDVVRATVLNEKANYKGKGIPFTAVLPGGPLPSGLLTNPYLYVGVKVVLKNQSILAIYVSKNKTMVNTNQYLQDHKQAKRICQKLLNSRNPILFDDDRKTFEILNGTKGIYLYSDVLKCSIQNEDAAFKGKTKPFTHTILGGPTFMAGAIEPSMYIGLKITLTDHSILAVYISKNKVLFNSKDYLKDREIALKLQKQLEKKKNRE